MNTCGVTFGDSRLACPASNLVSMGDWDDRLSAVKNRLNVCAVDIAGAAPVSSRASAKNAVDLCECVAVLDDLQQTLKLEFKRLQLIEIDAVCSHHALGLARIELAATQAGEVRARHLALHDVLTSLPNRIFFRERLLHALGNAARQRQSLAVLYLDLDGFKAVNDAHGHHAGDELLGIVAARLIRAVRADDMVSRLGGDEFACLPADLLSREHLSLLACKLFDAVSAPFRLGNIRLRVRPSIGIAVYPDDGDTVDALLDNADTAMYHAKRHRTGYAFFDRGVARCT